VFGFVIEHTGRYELPFFLSAGLLVIGALAALGIDPTRKLPQSPATRAVPAGGPSF
jgi:hypothetical protein